MKKNIYIFSVENKLHWNGVDSHISTLMNHITGLEDFECILFAFTIGEPIYTIERSQHSNNCTKIKIPLPTEYSAILRNENALYKYNCEVIDLISPFLKNKRNRIFHIHSLNIMPLAILIRKKYKGKIISHIHCIPWKYNMENNPKKFAYQYHAQYNTQYKELLLSVFGEKEAYNYSDAIICVSRSGANFVKFMQDKSFPEIYIIPNGLNDTFDKKEKNIHDNNLVFIFTGGISKSKGLLFILETIAHIPEDLKTRIKIIIAGFCPENKLAYLKNKFNDINLLFVGMISQAQLQLLYYKADIGIIMSLHEQCSYTAIEMMMYQLPILTTDADGLNDMFIDGYNAMVVPTIYNKEKAELNPDKLSLMKKLLILIENKSQRDLISLNARKTYLEKYRTETMMKNIINLYEKLVQK